MEMNSEEEIRKVEQGEANGNLQEPNNRSLESQGESDNDVIHSNRNILKSSELEEKLIYGITDRPPLTTTLVMAFQHFAIAISGCLALPFILSGPLCFDREGLSRLIATNLFVCGISSFLQTMFGTRLPIIQGPAAAFVVPTLSILGLKGQCPPLPHVNSTMEERTMHQEEAYGRLAEVQGALLIAAFVQCLIGFTGSIGFISRYIGPIPIAVAIANVGISLIPIIINTSKSHWGVAIGGMFLIILFSQFFAKWNIPCRGKDTFRRLFTFFPIFFSAMISWIICAILTVTNVFPDDPSEYGYLARTDIDLSVVSNAPWIYVPYPGQWGMPRFFISGIAGMIAGVFASILQSVGDYFSFALICGIPPPPTHALNRGVGMEGLACVLAAVCGTGNGYTSYNGNIAAVSLTKVGSRRVILVTSLMFTITGVIAKFSAFCSTIPSPILGGVIAVVLAMITGIGLANLSKVKMNTSRNLFIVGFSFFLAIGCPQYVSSNPGVINTGLSTFDDVVRVILNNGMFVGGFTAGLLDSLITGTPEERGLRRNEPSKEEERNNVSEGNTNSEKAAVYDLPFGSDWIARVKWFQFLPFSPTYKG
ncbi:putative solute carrier family 23 member 1-like [Apostichopus japonicus]|uniref:Putative solute carrier family 23 member 1-like n=1 Tax=Stichopus japonicus TaxID=307972 RepID=A0A2G8LAH1_STIJA|nr:putative solute carrier family 23 member 1-like [Apostichopus japonicus]